MSLPYPVNNQNMQIPDPDNPVTLPSYNNPQYGGNQMYPQLPQPELPYPTPGAMQLPPEPSDLPPPGVYPPPSDMPYPAQPMDTFQPVQGNIPSFQEQGFPAQPSAPAFSSESFDEVASTADLNEGLLSRTGEMLNLGK